MKKFSTMLACICLGLGSGGLQAHHSRSEYDLANPMEITGEVLSVTWRNPHIELRMKTDEGDEWVLESSSATVMNAAGVQQDVLQAGMQVSAAGGVSRRRDNRMLVSNILLPGNVELVMLINSPRRWQGETIGAGVNSQFVATSGRLPDDGRGLFRVWSFIPSGGAFWMTRSADQYPLTEKARTAAAAWDVYDPEVNLVLQCIAPGMPATMGSPHPMEFVELDSVIELRNEEFDVVRTIHMNPDADPASMPLSPLGYSVGRWEGDVLLVTTNRINAPYFNRAGVPLSEAAQVEERFTVDAENGALDYRMTVTDPENLTEPFIQELTWTWIESARLQRYDCSILE